MDDRLSMAPLAVIPRELWERCILPEAVEAGFLPGMMGASRRTRSLAAGTFSYLANRRHQEVLRAAESMFAFRPQPKAPKLPSPTQQRVVQMSERALQGGGPSASSMLVATMRHSAHSWDDDDMATLIYETCNLADDQIPALFNSRVKTLEFNFSSFGLTSCPPQIRNFHELRALWMPHCALSALPEVGTLPNLCFLDVHNNSIGSISYQIASTFPRLAYLDLNGNDIFDRSGSNLRRLTTVPNLEFLGFDAFEKELNEQDDDLLFPKLIAHCAGDILYITTREQWHGEVLPKSGLVHDRLVAFVECTLDSFRGAIAMRYPRFAEEDGYPILIPVAARLRELFLVQEIPIREINNGDTVRYFNY